MGEFGASARVTLVIGTLPCPCATACARSSKEEYTLSVLVSSTCSPAKQQKETGPPDLCQYSTRPTSCGQTVTTWLYVMSCRKKTWTCLVTVADVLTCGNDFFFPAHIFLHIILAHASTHVCTPDASCTVFFFFCSFHC